jgi:hypothetical protein
MTRARSAGIPAVIGTAAVFAAAVAQAVAINGTFTVFSDGQWAQTDQSYHDEASVTQTWTVTSTCTTYQDCTGHLTSDQGWSSDNLVYMSGRWKSYPDQNLVGWDQTLGPSGACGFSRWLNVTMPLRLTPTG